MSDAEQNIQGQKVKVSKLAVWSIGLAPIFILLIIGIIIFPNILFIVACLFSVPIGITFSIISLLKIKKSNGQLKGAGLAVGGLIIYLVLVTGIIWMAIQLKPELDKVLCRERLYGLRQHLHTYRNYNNERYPLADEWCDLLKKYDCPELYFVCYSSGTQKGLCDYAMNSNANPDSLPDMVLIFESKSGWNQVGGAELLNLENHDGEGCNVLFNDGSVRFVRKDEIGNLRWKDEEE